MSDFVSKRQLRHLRRDARVVVHERNDARIKRALGALVQTANRFSVRLVLFANAAGSTGSRCNPGQPKRTAGKISVLDMRRRKNNIQPQEH